MTSKRNAKKTNRLEQYAKAAQRAAAAASRAVTIMAALLQAAKQRPTNTREVRRVKFWAQRLGALAALSNGLATQAREWANSETRPDENQITQAFFIWRNLVRQWRRVLRSGLAGPVPEGGPILGATYFADVCLKAEHRAEKAQDWAAADWWHRFRNEEFIRIPRNAKFW